MKNIHLIPTDKPSRLIKIKDDLFFGKNERAMLSDSSLDIVAQNIYVTSDEEIKEGDWVYFPISNEVLKIGNSSFEASLEIVKTNKDCKKIILTTDQDLISDGIQAIDDEFLEWFVKNPSCENVEVQKWTNYSEVKYKLIIPQEEPKQENLTYSESSKKEERIFNSTLTKQENLEEASWRYNPVKKLDGEFIRQAFKEGASWQAEQLYKDDAIQTLEKGLALLLKKQERMYSEEDMDRYAEYCTSHVLKSQIGHPYLSVTEWFKQFKK